MMKSSNMEQGLGMEIADTALVREKKKPVLGSLRQGIVWSLCLERPKRRRRYKQSKHI